MGIVASARLNFLDESDGVGGYREAAADVVAALVGRGLEADGADGQAGRGGEGGFYLGEARGDFGALGDERGVEINGGEAAFFQFGDDVAEEELRVGVFPDGVGVGEKVA